MKLNKNICITGRTMLLFYLWGRKVLAWTEMWPRQSAGEYVPLKLTTGRTEYTEKYLVSKYKRVSKVSMFWTWTLKFIFN